MLLVPWDYAHKYIVIKISSVIKTSTTLSKEMIASMRFSSGGRGEEGSEEEAMTPFP